MQAFSLSGILEMVYEQPIYYTINILNQEYNTVFSNDVPVAAIHSALSVGNCLNKIWFIQASVLLRTFGA